MTEETKVQEAIEEIKGANEEALRSVIEKWYEATRMDGAKMGATYISAAIYGVIKKHINKPSPSLRDYKRMKDEIINIVSVQLTKQNDSAEGTEDKDTTEGISNDGTAE